MLESIFIIMIAMAFVLFILGIYDKSIIFSFMSLMLWMIVMINAHYIEVPSDESYNELGFSAFCMAFIIGNIIWIIVQYFERQFENRMP